MLSKNRILKTNDLCIDIGYAGKIWIEVTVVLGRETWETSLLHKHMSINEQPFVAEVK